jgi:hypothetical protein
MSLKNGNTAATGTIETNPYISNKKFQSVSVDEVEKEDATEEEEKLPATDPQIERAAKRRHQQKVFVTAAVLLLVLFIFFVIVYANHKTRINYEVHEKQPVKQQKEGAVADNSDLTLQAIKQAHDVIAASGTSNSPESTVTPVATNPVQQAAQSSTSPFLGQTVKPPEPSVYVPGFTSTKEEPRQVTINAQGSTRGTDSMSTLSSTIRRESSIYITETEKSKNRFGSISNTEALQISLKKSSPPIVLPSFGSVLPIRTLGAIYTLRTGSLVRLELTRDVNGDGWSLKRGTTFVGTTRGSESDRAYVSAIGFIDSASGRLVKITGEVVGTDGGEGLKGKRHQISSGWKRALGKLSSSAISLGGALATGRGSTVVVADGSGMGAINPVTEELNGVIGAQAGQQQSGFVEVVADTSGYILVTDLPAETKGVDAVPDIKSDEVIAQSNPDVVRVSTGLSLKELADLLSTGSPEEIKAALPRMTPDMKRVALAVIGEDK